MQRNGDENMSKEGNENKKKWRYDFGDVSVEGTGPEPSFAELEQVATEVVKRIIDALNAVNAKARTAPQQP